MNRFIILPNTSWFTNPENDTRQRGKFISRQTNAFYHSDYRGGNSDLRKETGTVENIITTLKNQFQNTSREVLIQAGNNLIQILREDLPKILLISEKENLTVCVVPRSKAEKNYSPNQLVF